MPTRTLSSVRERRHVGMIMILRGSTPRQQAVMARQAGKQHLLLGEDVVAVVAGDGLVLRLGGRHEQEDGLGVQPLGQVVQNDAVLQEDEPVVDHISALVCRPRPGM